MSGFYIGCSFLGLLLLSCGTKKSLGDSSQFQLGTEIAYQPTKKNDSTFVLSNGFLTKNPYGLWEMYLKGNPSQLGHAHGSLARDLFHQQEDALLQKVGQMVPKKRKQWLLRQFLAWFNRKLPEHVTQEYKEEIYALSRHASEKYNYIAPPYQRILYLHGAHDIGHALQDLALVGCSSFAVWGDKTQDGQLLLGRNFDFYAGDDFAKEKIVAFVEPDMGHKFMSVTWGGMIGVVSGMNDQGITVTINAGKSRFPLVAKTPISLVTREILQYAATIEEAIAIAQKREVFVSESILVGSAKDRNAIIIEMAPNNFGTYSVENSSQLVCSNHFQSSAYESDTFNHEHILESHSKYRFDRMVELLNEEQIINAQGVVDILRNKEGIDDKALGYGNEKALNQLLAHHGIVFKPESLQVWVSTHPYQLGEFVGYDLNKIFDGDIFPTDGSFSSESLLISEDPFQYSQEYKDYQHFRKLKAQVIDAIDADINLDMQVLNDLKNSNPQYWLAHFLSGKYKYNRGYFAAALIDFEMALSREVTTLPDQQRIERYIKKIQRRIRP